MIDGTARIGGVVLERSPERVYTPPHAIVGTGGVT